MNCGCDIVTLLLLLCCCNKGDKGFGGCGGGCGCNTGGCGCDCCDIIWLIALLNCVCGNKCCK